MTKDFWLLKNVLITGASGFLGTYVVEQLVNKGANVVAVVRDNVPKSRLFYANLDKKITIVNGDISDYFFLERVFNEYEIETVFHLAAQTIVPIANRSPISTFESNIKGTWNVLENCRKAELIKEVIVASSDKAYGAKEQLPYYETDPLHAMHPYDLSKTFTDLLAQSYFVTYGLPTGITRCGNLYGGGDLNFNRIVPQTIRSLLFDQHPEIRSDGTFTRDYFYVEDAADSYLMLAENLRDKNLQGEAFNFGTGNPVSVINLVNKMIKIAKKPKLKPKILNTAKGEIKDQYLSCEKAGKVLNWKPAHSLDEGLEKSYNWYKKWFQK